MSRYTLYCLENLEFLRARNGTDRISGFGIGMGKRAPYDKMCKEEVVVGAQETTAKLTLGKL